ncbi:MAG: hypothetical protein HY913_11985 [Desulfomonile tiedjei]|nr:hypothetical protein [Desulfomonile tiedjei]
MQPDEHDAGYLLDMLQHARGVARAVEGLTVEDYLSFPGSSLGTHTERLRLLQELRGVKSTFSQGVIIHLRAGASPMPRRGSPTVATGVSPWTMVHTIIWITDPEGVDHECELDFGIGRPLQGR